ncbi:hypothetical protein [Candidatus Azoamicus ciliaticola]|uniref:DUF1737 domain-containing protein n=1 Tax=Candidatus Azoamicus ciliaticola TaxID=2652803 RepID=A0A6J5JVZ8_9GAMM|nr:hypothetical protein [Candidatus Azoamicus ciliaticola]CAB3976488.1 Uncharacterised protein [Candidatus Azoamicus ciliaticola]
MKPCIIIKGSDDNIEDFENKIALALEQGYELSGELITHVLNLDGEDVIILLQPMFLSNDSYNENY